MLGAAALGDIGTHFPDSDPQWKNADSIILLKKTYSLINSKGYSLGNADITIITESPKISPYIQEMRTVISNSLNTDINNISIKATTEEKLGFTGDGSGIAANAIVLLEKT